MPYSTPLMFTSIIRSHSSILRRSSGDCGIRPALLIITSIRPCACTAPSTSFFTCSLWMTSVGTASAFPPRRVSSSASDLMRSARRAPNTTVAPCADKSRAVASPRPLLAPVMTTTFPWMLLLIARPLVLFVCDFLHPVDDLAVELFLDGDVGHGGGRRGAMPMLLAWRARDNITRSNDLDRPAPALHIAAAGSDDQGLAQRVGVPRAAGAWLERDVGTARTRRCRRLEKLVDAYGAGEILGRPSGGGLRTVSFDVHLQSPLSDWCGANYRLTRAAPVD